GSDQALARRSAALRLGFVWFFAGGSVSDAAGRRVRRPRVARSKRNEAPRRSGRRGTGGYSAQAGGRAMSDRIRPIVMPKWGLAMQEGMVAKWLVEEGAEIGAGDEILDIETSKIANVFESPVAGPLRRIVVGEGETVPVG